MSDRRLAEALVAWAARPSPAAAAGVLAALLDSSVLLPFHAAVDPEAAAPVTRVKQPGHAADGAVLSLLTLTLDGGRRVLPVFTTTEQMRRWRIEARPVAVSAGEACRAALDEGWSGLLIDPLAPGFVVGPAALRALADGFLPVAGEESVSLGRRQADELLPPIEHGERPPAAIDLVLVLRRAIAREPAVAAAWLLRAGPPAELGLALRTPLDAAGLATIAGRLSRRIGPGRELSVAAFDEVTARSAAQRCQQLWP